MAVSSKQTTKGSAASSPSPGARIRPAGGTPRWSPWPTWLTLVGWPLLLLGQRVLDAEEGMSQFVSVVAVLALIVGFGLSILTVKRSPADRRPAARVLSYLSGAGLLALLLYGASTEFGREALSVQRPKIGKDDPYGDIVTVAWLGLATLTYLSTLLGELARLFMQRAERVESRRVTNAVVAGAALSLAAIYGALFTYGADKLDVSADFSFFRTAKPSESTRRMVDSLEDPLTVMLFFPQLNEVGRKVGGYLQELAQGSDKVTVETYDREMVPEIAKENKVRKDGVVVLVRDDNRQTLELGIDEKKVAGKLKKLDGEFQKVLLKVMRGQRTAYLTVGHDELNESTDKKEGRTAKGLKQLLEREHYKVKNLGLAEGLGAEIPDDATMVMVLGPRKPFLPEEVSSLQRYADRGGHLLLALDPDGEGDLAPLAAIAGLKWQQAKVVHDRVLVPRRRNDSDKAILVAKRFSSHASVSTLSKEAARGAVVLLPGAAPLERLEKVEEGLKIDFAVKGMAGSYVDLDQNFQFDRDTEKRGTYNLVAAASRPPVGKAQHDKDADDTATGPAEMRAFVIGDVDAFSDAFLSFAQTNIVLFLEAVRWLGGEESFTADISTTEDVRIVHTKNEDQVWFYGSIIGVPAMVLGVGLVLARRRRKKASRRPAAKKAASSERKKGSAKSSDAERTARRASPKPDEADEADQADEADEEPDSKPRASKNTIAESPEAKSALKDAVETAKAARAKREADDQGPDSDDEDEA